MWWKDANASQRATVRQLVQEGRLEWTGGGWTQHDEVPQPPPALTHRERPRSRSAACSLFGS